MNLNSILIWACLNMMFIVSDLDMTALAPSAGDVITGMSDIALCIFIVYVNTVWWIYFGVFEICIIIFTVILITDCTEKMDSIFNNPITSTNTPTIHQPDKTTGMPSFFIARNDNVCTTSKFSDLI